MYSLKWLLGLAVFVSAGCCFGYSGLHAAESNALTLADAVRLALERNPAMKAAAGRVESAEGRVDSARAWSNPELELATEDMPLRNGSVRDSKNTVGVAQTFSWPGKKRLQTEIAATEAASASMELELDKVSLVRDVKNVFYSALAAERLVKVGRELLEVSDESASTSRKRVEAGAAADQELLRAELQQEQARSQLRELENEQHIARARLGELVGIANLESAVLAGDLPEHVSVARFERTSNDWLAKHPAITAAQKATQSAEMEARRARLEPYPDLRVGVGVGREGRDDNPIGEFRISVPLPIFDRSKGLKREAAGRVLSAEAELHRLEQRLMREQKVLLGRVRTASAQAAAYRDRILPKSREALRLLRTGFQEGKFGLMDLLDTQRTASEANLEYQRKLLELNTAAADLEALLGLSFEPAPKNN